MTKGSPGIHSKLALNIVGRLSGSLLGKKVLTVHIPRLVSVLMDNLRSKALAARTSAALVSLFILASLLHDGRA